MRERRHRNNLAAMDQINVTPLLDLTFLLLIAFMITMPLMEYGTNVKPPEMNAEELPTENFATVSLKKDGTIFLNNDAISREELMSKLQELNQREPKVQLLVRGDGEQSYNNVIDLLVLVRKAGITDATLVTQAESDPK